MIDLFHRVIKESGIPLDEIGGIGIGVPGTVDMEHGVVLFLPNLPTTWPNIPLAEYIQKGTTLPTVILNDVRAITFGEWRFGAGQGVDTMACFAIGTGIGGGLVINRQLHLGFGGTAGELGHITVDVNGPRCGCGNYGCVEVFASGPAIAAMGIKAVVQGWTTQIGTLVDYDLNRITPEVIARAARNGDAIAREIFEIAGGISVPPWPMWSLPLTLNGSSSPVALPKPEICFWNRFGAPYISGSLSPPRNVWKLSPALLVTTPGLLEQPCGHIITTQNLKAPVYIVRLKCSCCRELCSNIRI